MDITKSELIADLSKVFKQQNDIDSMSNEKLIESWKMHGIHAGTWEWEDGEITIVDEY